MDISLFQQKIQVDESMPAPPPWKKEPALIADLIAELIEGRMLVIS